MPTPNLHEKVLRSYILHMTIRDSARPQHELNVDDLLAKLLRDIKTYNTIRTTRYLNPRERVAKAGSLHLAWVFAQNPFDHGRFLHMLRVSPQVFYVILRCIENHPVFTNNSHVPQAPVDLQLAVTLFRMGRFGNAASLEDIAREAGCSEGAVELFTRRCFDAIESLHDTFVRPLTEAEKEVEKAWMDQHMGFVGEWRDGFVMYDGTIVVLYARPGRDGDAYYTRKSNYGLNVQVRGKLNQLLSLLTINMADWKRTFEPPNRRLLSWVHRVYA